MDLAKQIITIDGNRLVKKWKQGKRKKTKKQENMSIKKNSHEQMKGYRRMYGREKT